jgi:hypothetical protein
MSTYLFVYRHHKDAVLGTPETIAASKAFFERIEPSLADMGNPIFARTAVGACGEDTLLGGYSLVTADSFEDAVALAEGHWLLDQRGGVEVGELTRLSAGRLATSLADHPGAA